MNYVIVEIIPTTRNPITGDIAQLSAIKKGKREGRTELSQRFIPFLAADRLLPEKTMSKTVKQTTKKGMTSFEKEMVTHLNFACNITITLFYI